MNYSIRIESKDANTIVKIMSIFVPFEQQLKVKDVPVSRISNFDLKEIYGYEIDVFGGEPISEEDLIIYSANFDCLITYTELNGSHDEITHFYQGKILFDSVQF